MFDFSGKNILVTGASSGIGKACAEYLDSCGARMILVARRKERLEKLAEGLGPETLSIPCDFGDVEHIGSVFEKLGSENIKLDGLLHSAGEAPIIPVSRFDYPNALKTFNVNFFSFCEIIRYCSKKRYMNNNAAVVIVSAISVITGHKAQGTYVATKSALESYMRIAAKELVDKGIRLNAIRPAGVNTPMSYDPDLVTEEYREYMKSVQKLGMIEPVELAKTTAFLLSDDSRYMSGLSIPVDAGLLYCSGEF